MTFIYEHLRKILLVIFLLILFFNINFKVLLIFILLNLMMCILLGYFILFLKIRSFFEIKLNGETIAKYQQLMPMLNLLNIENKRYSQIIDERNIILREINRKKAEKFILYESIINRLLWAFPGYVPDFL